MSIHLRIRQVREHFKFSKIKMAALLKIDDSQYGKAERGEIGFTLNNISELCSGLGIDANWLILNKGSMKYNDSDTAKQMEQLIQDKEYLRKALVTSEMLIHKLQEEILLLKSKSGLKGPDQTIRAKKK